MQFQKFTKLSFLLASVTTVTLLSGCASSISSLSRGDDVSANSKSLEVVSSSDNRHQSEVSIDANSTLSTYLQVAALNNPGLEAAFNRWKAALQKVPQVTSLPDPRFNYGYFIQEVETRVGPQEQKIGIAQTFPWFGKLRLRGQRAGEAAIAAREKYVAAKVKLFFSVKDAYYELFYLRQAIAITKDNIGLMKHLESVAQARFRAGSDLTGVVKAQVELGTLEDNLLSLEELREPIVAKLNSALNRPLDAKIPWPTEFITTPVKFTDQEMSGILDENNPELRGIAANIAAEEKAIDLAKKEFWPDVTLGVDYLDTGNARMAGVSDSGKDPVMVMASINIPLWWGKYRAAVREAEARRDGEAKWLENRENVLEADLKMALYKFRDAERKIGLFGKTLTPLAKNSLRVSEQAYESGKSDFLELIDAQRMLLGIQLSNQRALADREQRFAEIEMLLGRDLVPSEGRLQRETN